MGVTGAGECADEDTGRDVGDGEGGTLKHRDGSNERGEPIGERTGPGDLIVSNSMPHLALEALGKGSVDLPGAEELGEDGVRHWG